MKRAIIFDMDGVLFDTEPVYAQNRRLFFASKGIEMSEAEARQFSGWNSKEYMARVFSDKTAKTVRQYIQEYRQFAKSRNEGIFPDALFDGVPETLEYLRRQGCELALASNSQRDRINQALDSVGIRLYFSCILSSEAFTHMKPDPEIYETMVADLQRPKDEIIVVEDSTYGIQAAQAADLEVICKRDTRFPYDQRGCQYYIDDIRELTGLYKNL